jgi:hypothetical protein
MKPFVPQKAACVCGKADGSFHPRGPAGGRCGTRNDGGSWLVYFWASPKSTCGLWKSTAPQTSLGLLDSGTKRGLGVSVGRRTTGYTA